MAEGGKAKGTLQVAGERITALANTLTGRPNHNFPHFDQLPKVPGQPQGCLWGVFDKNGERDELGTLNLLTPSLVAATARNEIQTGKHIQLDWELHNVEFPGFERKEFQQTVVDLAKIGFSALDDEISINTQSGSQWDSFKHFAHQKSGLYYNGLSHAEALASPRNGIHKWCERGGIVGRGVLVDWVRWHEAVKGTPPSPVTRHEIPLEEIEAALAYQGTRLQVGDILIIRSGYVRWHDFAGPEERKRGTREHSTAIGLRNDEHMVRWLYDHHFAAVAGDTVAFEAWPPPMETGWCLHEWLLTQWGTPIGEMWDLESLSKECEAQKRWTFFLTSAPLHVRGGIGSPPGAIAIF